MSTAAELEEELRDFACFKILPLEENSQEWRALVKEWILKFEGPYTMALHAEGQFPFGKGKGWLENTPLSSTHHAFCRSLADDFLGVRLVHPGNR